MAKINIHVELDTQNDDLSTLTAIADIFGGKVVVEPKSPTLEEAPVEEKGDPKTTTKKKPKKAVAEEPVKEEKKTGGLLSDEAVKALAEGTTKEPEAEEKYTVDDVRTIMATAKRSGKATADLRAILKANGAAVVSDLNPKVFAKVIKEVEAL